MAALTSAPASAFLLFSKNAISASFCEQNTHNITLSFPTDSFCTFLYVFKIEFIFHEKLWEAGWDKCEE